jgi:hypothetical protein
VVQTFSMSFFEPLPPPPPEPSRAQQPGWRPPIWDRPSEALLGAPIESAILLGKSEQVAVVLDNLHAFPNGFQFSLAILLNPMNPRDPMDRGPGMGPGGLRGPRIGFEFSNGTRTEGGGRGLGGFPGPGARTQMMVASRQGAVPRNPFGVPVDDDGLPIDPILMPRGGGGNGQRFDVDYWCYPLPSPGPMTIYSEWADQGIQETATVFDAHKILAAVPRVITLWDADS